MISKYWAFIVTTDILGLKLLNSLINSTMLLSTANCEDNSKFIKASTSKVVSLH